MWTEKQRQENKRAIIAQNVDGDTVGRKLTSEAREKAIDFGVKIWQGDMGNGQAAEIGIKHATSDVIKE